MGRLRRSHDKEEIIVAVKTLLERFETNVRYAKVKPDKETNFDLLACSWGVSLLQSFAKEIHCWATLEHKNIVKLEGFVLGSNGYPSLISRWATHGRVVDYLKGNPRCDVIGLVRFSN